MAKSHLLWGKTIKASDIDISWHVSSEAEKTYAIELLDGMLAPSMARIRELISDEPNVVKPTDTHEIANEFCRHIAVLQAFLVGAACLIRDDGVDEANASDDNLSVYVSRRCSSGQYAYMHPFFLVKTTLKRSIVVSR